MLSIGRFAKLAQISPRAVRYYESIGLIQSASRGENNYRYYDSILVDVVAKIRSLQGLGFSLDEIKDIITFSPDNFTENLRKKLEEVDAEILAWRERRAKLINLLSVSMKIDSEESINDTERKDYMNAIHEEVLKKLKAKHGTLSEKHLKYLARDRSYQTEQQREFIAAIKRCLQFAKDKDLRLGPSRGSASASIVLHAFDLFPQDPTEHGFFPERLLTQAPNVHIDVEYERGQEFVDFCREETRKLSYGEIQAFKMPLLDILNAVDARLPEPRAYEKVSEDDEAILAPFRRSDLEKIFLFDCSPNALIMMLEKNENEYTGEKYNTALRAYIASQHIYSFRDVMNITAIWRPYSQKMIDRLEVYKQNKIKEFRHECLTSDLQNDLRSNFGMIIYHEELLKITAYYTGWSGEKCNELRRVFGFKKTNPHFADSALYQEFKNLVPTDIHDLYLSEVHASFCLPHIVAYSYFTKATAWLQNLHRDIYFDEIAKWEEKHELCWDDIGVAWKGFSLLQN